jgi:alginate O-acetyltransferase complex protein AlgI
MIFTSFEFLFFFAFVLLVRSCLRNFSAEKWFLLAASYVFYMSWNVPLVLLLLSISLVNYYVGLRLGQTVDHGKQKLLLIVSIAVSLGVLGYYKYSNFLLDNAWGALSLLGFHSNRWQYDIILPVGISFFTFISLTYTIGIYRRNIQPCGSPRDFLLFVAFFPQILAGPINRTVDMLPQFKQRMRATALDFESGAAQFAVGAVKKLVIADRIAPHVDLIFAAPGNYDGFTLLQGLLGYAIQIYCDFSGYADMAIGAARMMGFKFMENFQMPYSAVTITEFWRRWHISLSTWFRDYLYIPLGGKRKGQARTYINLMLTMLLCGLWHGASWNYIFWGGLHGLSLAIHRAWQAWHPLELMKDNPAFQFIWTLFSRLLTISVVLIGWLFFRAPDWSVASEYFSRIMAWSQDGTRLVSPYILSAIAAVFLAHLVMNKDWNWELEIPKRSIPVRILNYSALAVLLACLGATDSSPFIYFKY